MDIKFQADTKMADSKRELEMQKAAFNQEVNTKVELRYTSGYFNTADALVNESCDTQSTTYIILLSFHLSQKAEAQLAYELQAAKEQQKIRLEEIEIEVVQRKKQITIEEKEILRTEKELIATVRRPAEAEAYKMQQLAEANK